MLLRLLGLMAVMTGGATLAHAETMAPAPAAPRMVSMTMVSATTAASPTAMTSTEAYKAVETKTRAALAGVSPTGDVEVDFLRMVMPYQKAISDLSTAALKYSSDADIRMMAGDMVKQEEASLRTAREWMRLHGPQDGNAGMPEVKDELPVATSSSVVPLNVTKPASVKKTITMSEFLEVSKTVPPVSSSVPVTSPSLPPVDVLSPTHAFVSATVVSATHVVSETVEMMPDGMPAALTPSMPAHDAEIVNTAPKMEFLDDSKPAAQ